MLFSSIVSFVVVIICCKTIKLGSQWRLKDVRLYWDVPGKAKCCKALL